MTLRNLFAAACAASIACGDSFDSSGTGNAGSTSSGTGGESRGPADTSGDASASTSVGGSAITGSTGGDGADENPVSYDLGGVPDTPESKCDSDNPSVELSYIWIANTTQETISKINTETMVEEGRYRAKATGGDPSRTSGISNGGGCMSDGDNLIWHAGDHSSGGPGELIGVNIETLEVEHTIPVPEYVHGISIDFQGKVWGVSFQGSNAYRVDPSTATVDVFTTLVGAYTYSDMTGFALSTAGSGVPPN